MIKTIEELTSEAEYLHLVITLTTEDAEYHNQEALKSRALAATYRQQLDGVERELISARGESS